MARGGCECNRLVQESRPSETRPICQKADQCGIQDKVSSLHNVPCSTAAKGQQGVQQLTCQCPLSCCFDETCTLHTTGGVHVGDSSSKVLMSDLRASVTMWLRHCTAWLALLGSLKSARASPYSPHISFGQNILEKQTMLTRCSDITGPACGECDAMQTV